MRRAEPADKGEDDYLLQNYIDTFRLFQRRTVRSRGNGIDTERDFSCLQLCILPQQLIMQCALNAVQSALLQ